MITKPALHTTLLLAAALIAASACSSDGTETPADQSSASLPEVEATLAPGDTQFLIARQNVIDKITLSGRETRLVQLTNNVNILDLAISPAGQELAFVVELPAANVQGKLDFGTDLYVAKVDGSASRETLKHESVGEYFQAPAWIDESTLLMGSYGVDPSGGAFSRIESVDLTTGVRQTLLNNVRMGNLTPDRGALVYTTIDSETGAERLVISKLASLDSRSILVDESHDLGLFSAVAISPDGTRVAFAAVDLAALSPPPRPPSPSALASNSEMSFMLHPFAQDVWLVNIDGTGLRRVAETAENMPSLTWSGNGGFIYVLGPNYLWKLDPETGEALQQGGERGSIIWVAGD